ncbi:hypothetical protein NP233_g10848 [Leucocoprinus birnbaumii]|uniref:Uncharacterized protein n=1 Tax=Leucocoprinus birnbaumii TaxID=56174 RepID=A0AAD5VNJ2_9AGAR|nr:hypothetical protein NP233_g10848 [Leucocoprinus birnbaumii]
MGTHGRFTTPPGARGGPRTPRAQSSTAQPTPMGSRGGLKTPLAEWVPAESPRHPSASSFPLRTVDPMRSFPAPFSPVADHSTEYAVPPEASG